MAKVASIEAEDRQRKAFDAEFEEWWKAYPRKVNKGGARRAWRTARRKASMNQLMEAVGAFAYRCRTERREQKFIPHGSTWLNGERWLDVEAAEQRRRPNGPDGNEEHWSSGGGFWGDERDTMTFEQQMEANDRAAAAAGRG